MMTPEQITAMQADMEAGTPGPWVLVIDDDPAGIDLWHINDRDGDDFMGNRVFYPWQSNSVADARRIARVPEMEATIIAQAAEIERLQVALKDAADALEKFVDTEKVIREPYETPLSAYDRAREALK